MQESKNLYSIKHFEEQLYLTICSEAEQILKGSKYDD